jgi:hypothetical protein
MNRQDAKSAKRFRISILVFWRRNLGGDFAIADPFG